MRMSFFRSLSPAIAVKGGVGLVVMLSLGWALRQEVRGPAFLRAQGVNASAASDGSSEAMACGNGRLEPGEQCESDAHCIAGQICNRWACHCEGRVTDACGDGILKSEEQCELGYPCSGRAGACDLKNCVCAELPAEPTCGNSRIDSGEDCEIGVACPEGSACNFAVCHCEPRLQRCGNGVLDAGEQCEIGAPCTEEAMACDFATCRCAQQSGLAVCGNGQLGGGEECEVGHPCPAGWICDYPRCRCVDQPRCGDGTLDPGEQCETAVPCSGASQICDFSRCRCMRQTVACGNGAREAREECDDGNIRDGDGCSATCVSERPPQQSESGPASGERGSIVPTQESAASATDLRGAAREDASSSESANGPVIIVFPGRSGEGSSAASSVPSGPIATAPRAPWRIPAALGGAVMLLAAGGFFIRRRRRA